MQWVRVGLEDEKYWFLIGWAAREHCKAHEQATRLLELAITLEMANHDGEPNGDTEAA